MRFFSLNSKIFAISACAKFWVFEDDKTAAKIYFFHFCCSKSVRKIRWICYKNFQAKTFHPPSGFEPSPREKRRWNANNKSQLFANGVLATTLLRRAKVPFRFIFLLETLIEIRRLSFISFGFQYFQVLALLQDDNFSIFSPKNTLSGFITQEFWEQLWYLNNRSIVIKIVHPSHKSA